MNWTIILIALVVLVSPLLLKRMSQISSSAAADHLKHGAMVIDVRSGGEFNAGHLRTAINIPLDQVETLVPRRVKDKSQVLLLHCQSGARSGAAKKKLAALGYTQAYNLGSYNRAARIVGAV
jgi:rhodanese-related sulfurtransferase